MPYFRVVTSQLARIHSLLNKEDSWLIMINADPDALGSALALQRLLRTKTKKVHIARINEISRPDNLAMIRNLRIPVKVYTPDMLEQYDKFAIVDSQPHHSPLFAPIKFSIVIDHHPLPIAPSLEVVSEGIASFGAHAKTSKKDLKVREDICICEDTTGHVVGQNAHACNTCYTDKIMGEPVGSENVHVPENVHILENFDVSAKVHEPDYVNKPDTTEQTRHKHISPPTQIRMSPYCEESMQDIRPDYGATCSMLTEYLYHANIRPGKCLATAMQYGIRTDTVMFGRQSTEVDLRAFHYLSRFADSNMLMRIIRSEYLPQWLPYFTRAFDSFKPCGLGHFTYLSEVDSPDILVVIADFFLRVHGLKYIVVAGIYEKRIICIFRGSDVNLGLLAQKAFSEYGSAGGHKAMARAEIPLQDLRKLKKNMKFTLRKKKLSLEENQEIEDFLIARLKQFGTRKILREK